MRPTIRSLFEPHYKQNLYANPKRTAKFSIRPTYKIEQSRYLFKKNLIPSAPRKKATITGESPKTKGCHAVPTDGDLYRPTATRSVFDENDDKGNPHPFESAR